MTKTSFFFYITLLFYSTTAVAEPFFKKGDNGKVCSPWGCSGKYSSTFRVFYSDNLQIKSDSPTTMEAFVENNELVFLINGTRYDNSLSGSYYINDNKLYNTKTNKLAPLYGQSSLVKKGLFIVAAITIGYITYILYNNGTFALLAQKAQKQPYYAAGITLASLALLAGITYTLIN